MFIELEVTQFKLTRLDKQSTTVTSRVVSGQLSPLHSQSSCAFERATSRPLDPNDLCCLLYFYKASMQSKKNRFFFLRPIPHLGACSHDISLRMHTLVCVSLGKSESGFLIQDHLDHGVSKEPTNPLLVRIRRFL